MQSVWQAVHNMTDKPVSKAKKRPRDPDALDVVVGFSVSHTPFQSFARRYLKEIDPTIRLGKSVAQMIHALVEARVRAVARKAVYKASENNKRNTLYMRDILDSYEDMNLDSLLSQ